ncbi:hypothetical protein EFP17_28395 [Burkholderia glumae]|nr:hypothetical protein EFP17_28395 [Burkholderia glumae]
MDRLYGQISAIESALLATLLQLPFEQRQAVAQQLQMTDASALYTDASESFLEGFGTTSNRLSRLLQAR